MEEPKSDTIQSVLDAQDIMLEDENMRFDFKKIKKNIGRDVDISVDDGKFFYWEKDLIDFFNELIKTATKELKAEKYATGRVEKGAKLFLLKRIKKSLEGGKR